MSEKNKVGSAFPHVWVDNGMPAEVYHGMTLRDYFAAKAMQSILLDKDFIEMCRFKRTTIESVSKSAYRYADEMLAERDKE